MPQHQVKIIPYSFFKGLHTPLGDVKSLNEIQEFLTKFTYDHKEELEKHADHPNDMFGVNPYTLDISVNASQDMSLYDIRCRRDPMGVVFKAPRNFYPVGKLRDIKKYFAEGFKPYEKLKYPMTLRRKALLQENKLKGLSNTSVSNVGTRYLFPFDGGGIRGYSTCIWADLFFTQWGIDQSKVYEKADIIAGTSTGGIIALGLAAGFTPLEIAEFYLTQGPWIFTTSLIFPSVQATAADMAWAILTGGSAYSNARLISSLQEQFGDLTLEDLGTNVVVPSIRADTNSIIMFSNRPDFPNTMGSDYLCSDVAQATSALPIYFPTVFISDGYPYKDGGIGANNPSDVAEAYGAYLKPGAIRECMLSQGTGRGDIGYDNPEPDPDPPPYEPGILDQFALVEQLLEAPQRVIDLSNSIESSLRGINYKFWYKFQYQVDSDLCPNASQNTSPEAYEYFQAVAESTFEADQTNINAFIAHLNA